MKKTIFILYLLLVATGCSRQPASPQPTEPQRMASATPLANLPASTPSPDQGRYAELYELQNEVLSRPEAAAELAPAWEGQRIEQSGEVHTGENSRVLVTILPENTLLRLGPDSRLALHQITPADQTPYTRLQLFFGQIWVLLRGGSLDVETETGLASVRGSLLSVRYDPENALLTVTCLEGECQLANETGQVSLTGGQAASIAGEVLSPPRPMKPEEVQDWLENMPESAPYVPPQLQPAGEPTDARPPIQLYIYNGCPDGEAIGGAGNWVFIFTNLDSGDVHRYTISNGDETIIDLPGGNYQGIAIYPDGLEETRTFNTEDTGNISINRCGDEPDTSSFFIGSEPTPGQQLFTPSPGGSAGAPPTPTSPPGGSAGAPPTPTSPPGGSAGVPPTPTSPPGGSAGAPPTPELLPATYVLTNNCPDVWHWRFVGPATIEFDILPGETATGSLIPIGTYEAYDWFDGQAQHQSTVPAGGNLVVTSCQ